MSRRVIYFRSIALSFFIDILLTLYIAKESPIVPELVVVST